MRNILFYKYVAIANVNLFCKEHLKVCKSLGLKGKVLVAPEGMNGSLTGEEKEIRKYQEFLKKDPRFKEMVFKEAKVIKHGFLRMLVKPRKEIITSRFNVEPAKNNYIKPQELKKALDKGEEIILLDARNDFEYEVGHFEKALQLDLKQFSDTPQYLKKIQHLKDKKIVTYCTGGVRCEKFSNYLIQNGFKNTFQLQGGIITYGQVCGDKYWQGKCFVFDRRGAIEIDPQKQKESVNHFFH